MLEIVAGVEAAAGKLQKARETYRLAMESARRAKFDGVARNMAVDLDLVETELGNASQTSRAPSAVPNSEHARKAAAHIFATTGHLGRAGALAAELLRDTPTDTYVNNVWVPSIRAEIEVAGAIRQRPSNSSKPRLCTNLAGKRMGGRATFAGVPTSEPKRERKRPPSLQKILDHRGVCLADSLAPVFYALSHLQLARGRAISGDAAGARTAYQDFFNLWNDADSDVPILKQAKAEYAKLQ